MEDIVRHKLSRGLGTMHVARWNNRIAPAPAKKKAKTGKNILSRDTRAIDVTLSFQNPRPKAPSTGVSFLPHILRLHFLPDLISLGSQSPSPMPYNPPDPRRPLPSTAKCLSFETARNTDSTGADVL